jgi:hypothetical protein
VHLPGQRVYKGDTSPGIGAFPLVPSRLTRRPFPGIDGARPAWAMSRARPLRLGRCVPSTMSCPARWAGPEMAPGVPARDLHGAADAAHREHRTGTRGRSNPRRFAALRRRQPGCYGGRVIGRRRTALGLALIGLAGCATTAGPAKPRELTQAEREPCIRGPEAAPDCVRPLARPRRRRRRGLQRGGG